MKIVGARGLHWASRVHLLQGIMSYLASPLWLLLLVAGLALAMIARYMEPNYFPDGFSLFPAWPVFDPERALRLFGLTVAVLYLPKLLGLIHALRTPELRQGCGGATGLFKSFMAETVLSMLLSPVMMLIQSRFVADVLLGRDSGWTAQNRNGSTAPFSSFLTRYATHVMAGLVFGTLAIMVSVDTFLWFLPIMAGFVLAPVMAWVTSLAAFGKWLYHANVFRIPEEQGQGTGQPVIIEARELQAAE
jgi:membrane glycosyltransferase